MTDSTQMLLKNLADTFGHPIRSLILHSELRSVRCGERSRSRISVGRTKPSSLT